MALKNLCFVTQLVGWFEFGIALDLIQPIFLFVDLYADNFLRLHEDDSGIISFENSF